MKTVAVLARKGGVGKTTCAIHMGTLASASGHRVIFFDLDPQRSLTAWYRSREQETPALVETDAQQLPDLLKAARAGGYSLAVIDTPPAVSFDTARIAAMADLVLIPVRPSILDVYAVASTADVVRSTKTPSLVVLNACIPPTERGEASTTAETRTALEGLSNRMAQTSLAQRVDYSRALNEGAAVTEFAPDSRAAVEMTRLWREVEQELA